MSLQDYFPISLAGLVQRATVIKPKVVQGIYHTYLLTAEGQVLRSKFNNVSIVKFTLWYRKPVQNIIIDDIDHNIILITLDAKILYASGFETDPNIRSYELSDVISVASRGSNTTAITNNGNFYVCKEDQDEFKLRSLAEPVVMTKVVSSEEFLLLRTNGKVWKYYIISDVEAGLVPTAGFAPEAENDDDVADGEIKDVNNIEGIASLSYKVLLRVDGKIYEKAKKYKLNEQVSNISIVDSTEFVSSMFNDSTIKSSLYINLITRSGRVLRKILAEKSFGSYKSPDGYQYKPIMLDGKVIAISGKTAILANGRVAQGKEVMTTIPRLNIFTHHK